MYKKTSFIFSLGFFLIGLGFYLYSSQKSLTHQSQNIVPTSNPVLGVQTKTANCIIQNAMPDPDCTPGAVFPDVTKDQICTSGYSSSVRDVSVATKQQVYAEYGLTYPQARGAYEVDHFISLELGGSNDISNLWPEAANPKPGFHEKDMVENYLHEEVCNGNVSLQEAQKEISTSWLGVYNKIK